MYPLSSNLARYPCTVAVELSPTAFPISLTDGGYPTFIICFSMYLNIDFSLPFNSGLFLGIYITPFLIFVYNIIQTKKCQTYFCILLIFLSRV